MLNDAKGFKRVIVCCGRTDLRCGINGLSLIIKNHYNLNPFEPGTLYMFCGGRTDRIKVLIWEEDGHFLGYKRLESGRFQWPRSEDEAKAITQEQFDWLMKGMKIEQKKSIAKITPLLPG